MYFQEWKRLTPVTANTELTTLSEHGEHLSVIIRGLDILSRE